MEEPGEQINRAEAALDKLSDEICEELFPDIVQNDDQEGRIH
jgi:hypothetical protein